MKIIPITLVFLFSCILLYAAETQELPLKDPPPEEKSWGSPLSFHRPMYLLLGNKDDQIKGQISFKYDPFFGVIENLGLYLAYTQVMDWKFYDDSSPFRDINFNPEVFWRLESRKNLFGNVDLRPLDYIQLGFYEHKSNGKGGSSSRSMDRSYIEIQASMGDTFNFGMSLKYFVVYIHTLDENNRDLQQYIGSWEARVFFKHLRNDGRPGLIEIYARFGAGGGPNGFNFYKGWQEYGIIFPSLFMRVKPYIQVFHGYGEFLLGYNEKRTETWDGTFLHGTGTAIRVGAILQ